MSAEEAQTTISESINYADLYKSYCEEHRCRVNSAVLGFIAKQPNRPLQHLNLANNYVGAKGVVPVLQLVERCQTIETIDLQGNGLDNKAVASLCAILEKHLGVSSLNLSHNPITLDGGRSVMQLLETNRKIIEVKIEGTDIFESLAARVQMAAAENYKHVTGKEPKVVASRPLSSRVRGQQEVVKQAKITAQPRRPISAAVQPTTQQNGSEFTNGTAAASESAAATPMKSIDVTKTIATPATPAGTSTASAAPSRPATSGPIKPRPPQPAIASREASRMTEAQREELRTRYKRRAEAYHNSAEKSPATQMADNLRQELALLEAAERRKHRPGSSSGLPQKQPSGAHASWTQHVRGASANITRGAAKSPAAEGDENVNKKDETPKSTSEASTPKEDGSSGNKKPPVVPRPPKSSGNDQRQQEDASPSQPNNSNLVSPTDEDSESPIMHALTISGQPAQAVASSTIKAEMAPKASSNNETPSGSATPMKVEDEGVTNMVQGTKQLVAVGAAEQFRTLFNLGCEQYNNKKLEAAFVTWSEAMELATQERSREWMSVITQNLRRLSYEMRAAEGMKHLEAMRLDDADHAFSDALAVATKASNAAWEAEMRRAIKNVLHTRFQKAHKDATALIDKLRVYKDQAIDETDDRFVPTASDANDVTDPSTASAAQESTPGQSPDTMVSHTATYFNEWMRMILVKEAVELWTDAAEYAKKIGGSSVKVLLEVVQSAVIDVSRFLWDRKLLPNESRMVLARFGAGQLRYDEAVKLRQLWTDLYAKSKALQIPTWLSLCQASLGHLTLAINSIPAALKHFEAMLQSAQEGADLSLEATARAYIALTHLQRSEHSLAEAQLKIALGQWADIRSRLQNEVAMAGKNDNNKVSTDVRGNALSQSMSAPQQGSPADGSIAPRSSGRTSSSSDTPVSLKFAVSMSTFCGELMVTTLVGSYRYRTALEFQEATLLHSHNDILREKICLNFTAHPTMNHITAVATTLGGPLFYLALSYRFEWNVEKDSFDVLEQLFMWVVPAEAELKFVQVDVTVDFKVASIGNLIEQLRDALKVDPHKGAGVQDNVMILTVPELQWKHPLQLLHKIIIEPVIDFLFVHIAYSDCGLVNLMPSGCLWGVPFPALMDQRGTYLVEQFAFAHCFSATQAAYAALSATRVRNRNAQKRFVIGAPSETDRPTTSTTIELPFELDTRRCTNEANTMKKTLQAEVLAEGATNTSGLKELLPQCRVLHIASPISNQAENKYSKGALCVQVRFDEIGLLHSDELATIELPAEIVSMSNCNMSVANATVSTNEEGSLCFTRAVLNAGACTVVSTQWCAPDMIPAVLFEKFYYHCRTEPHKSKALSYAIRSMLVEDGMMPPRLWAGAMVFGVGSL